MQSLKHYLTLALLCSLILARVALAQGANGITSPRDNAVVQGMVLIEGTAADPSFLRYELSFFKEFDPLGDWVVFATGDQPVVNGVLATWDTTVGREAGTPFYPDGTYRLRLRVVRQDSNYDEYFVLGISLSNEQPTATPTATPTSETAASPAPTFAIAVPTELPTLTPFPTATPHPTAKAGQEPTFGEESTSEPGGSFLNLEGEFSVEQIKSGLCLGGYIALAFFGTLVAYFLFRKGLRLLLAQARLWLSR